MAERGRWEEVGEEKAKEIAGWIAAIEREYRVDVILKMRLRPHPSKGLEYEIEASALDPRGRNLKARCFEVVLRWPNVRHKSLWGAVYACLLDLNDLADKYRQRHPYQGRGRS